MIRLSLAATLLLASAALATGERIVVTGDAAPLADTLCLQMTCVEHGGRDFVVTGHAVPGGVEVSVTTASGQRRLTERVPLNTLGHIGSTDLVHLTSLVFKAIEDGPVASEQPKKKAAPSRRLATRRALSRALAHR